MKKLIILLAAFSLILGACGARGVEPNEVTKEQKEEAKVKIVVPSSYLPEDGLVEAWDNTLYTGVEVGETETVYYMTETQHESIIEDSKSTLDAMMTQVAKSSKYEAVKSMTQSNDFASIRLDVDKATYEKSDKDALFQTIGLPLIHYQLLKGEKVDAFVIECTVYDETADEMVAVVNLPMDLSNGTLE